MSTEEQRLNPLPEAAPCVPGIGLREYIRRDLAHAHGIDRDHLAELDAKPRNEWSPTQRQWGLYAEKAEIAALDWIIGRAPGVIPHLRAAGLYVPAAHEVEWPPSGPGEAHEAAAMAVYGELHPELANTYGWKLAHPAQQGEAVRAARAAVAAYVGHLRPSAAIDRRAQRERSDGGS